MKKVPAAAQDLFTGPSPLYLFACRVRCVRLGDQLAYEELMRASKLPDEDIRAVAETFLEEVRSAQADSRRTRWLPALTPLEAI